MLAIDLATLAVAAATILFSGRRLVRHADAIALGTPLGRTRVGFLLLAAATSLPDLVSAVTAGVFLDLPNIAVGSLLGTLPLNLVVLATAEFAVPGVLSGLYVAHRRSFWTCVAAVGLAGAAVLAGPRLPVVGGVGLVSPLLVAGYAWVALRRQAPSQAAPQKGERLGRSVLWFLLHATIVGAAAMLLPGAAAAVADASGLSRAFVATAVVAAATTLPELVVAWAALRHGAVDMARGNALGSILFNLAFLGALDGVVREPLLAQVDAAHAVTAAGALWMLGVVGLARPRPGGGAARLAAWSVLGAHLLLLVGVWSVGQG